MGYFDDAIETKNDTLEHHGIRGQKWGVRRFQNADGSLTTQGRSRYGAKADKVENKLKKATKWEDRAVNAKTRFGRELATAIGTAHRQTADKVADKATKDYHALHLNKNASRNMGAAAETQSRVAEGLKARAEKTSDSKKREKLMDAAVKSLATAENMEIGAKMYSRIANAPGLAKGGTFIKEVFNTGFGTAYTTAGRKTTGKERLLEQIGNSVLDQAFNLGKNKAIGDNDYSIEAQIAKQTPININTAVNTVGKVRDAAYKKKNSAKDRWNKIVND